MKKESNSTLNNNNNNNETNSFNAEYYRNLRQKYGVELSGIQTGFYHVIQGDKQLRFHRELKLNYNPQYGIYTAFSLLLLLLLILFIASYYKIKLKIRSLLMKSQKTTLNHDNILLASTEIIQLVVIDDQIKPKSLNSSNGLSVESLQKIPKIGKKTRLTKDEGTNFCEPNAHFSQNVSHSWNSLNILQSTSQAPKSTDADSLSIKTLLETTPFENCFS